MNLIDRQKLIDKMVGKAGLKWGHLKVCNPLLGYIETAPTVEERTTGKWNIHGQYMICTNCREILCTTDREGDEIPRAYCPMCGARMTEVGE